LDRRLEWLGLATDFSELQKEELVTRADGSARTLIRELDQAFRDWVAGNYVT